MPETEEVLINVAVADGDDANKYGYYQILSTKVNEGIFELMVASKVPRTNLKATVIGHITVD